MQPDADALYLSDLDGTLLGATAELSAYTVEMLNALIRRGLPFSIATARTAASVARVLAPLEISVPVVLMNGAQVYELKTGHYLHTEYLPRPVVTEIAGILQTRGITGFMYGLENDTMSTYYESLESESLRTFHQERVVKYGKTFTHVETFSSHADQGVLYFVMRDRWERLAPVHDALLCVPGLAMSFYPDIYTGDLWYLEVFSDRVSKGHAAEYLRNRLGFGRLVGFGDNLNDLSLFEVCDEAYAVSNAQSELAVLATAQIGSNIEDGVAHWLDARFKEA